MSHPWHNRSDQFGKSLLRDALRRASAAETEVEVIAATQKIDVYSVPDPAREAERASMGMLGELSAEPSLFEPYRNTPSLGKARHCLRKQLTWHHELERRSRASAGQTAQAQDMDPEAPPATPVPFPALVIVSPGRPATVLEAFGCQGVQPGVYHAVSGLVMRVVVLAELQRTRETLLLRLLGSGRGLREALADLGELPDDAWEKSVATPLLIHFRLEGVKQPANQEDDVDTEIQAWWEDYQQKQQKLQAEAREAARTEGLKEGLDEGRKEGRKEGRNEGRKEGRNEGRKEGERKLLLRQLRARFGELPAAAVARVEAAEEADLERWGERILGAQALADVLDTPC